MANFNRDRSDKGGGRRDFRRDSGRPPQLFDATCSHCGKPCKVPFRPTGDKPVYCRDCFVQGGHDQNRQDRGERPDRGDKRGDRYDKPRFDKPAPAPVIHAAPANNDEIKRQLENVNAKLERLISAVQGLAIVQQLTKSLPTKKAVAKKVAKRTTKNK